LKETLAVIVGEEASVGCGIHVEGKLAWCEGFSWRTRVFRDRIEAGAVLAEALAEARVEGDIVYAIAAGGVPVGYAVAERMELNLDTIVVKKITFPWTTEAGFGAVALEGIHYYNKTIALASGLEEEWVRGRIREIADYVVQRTLRLRGSTEYSVEGKRVIVVDDGIAMGYTMLVALKYLKHKGAARLIAAAPTAHVEGARLAASIADMVVVANMRKGPYFAVADAYREWRDISDEEALEYLRRRSPALQAFNTPSPNES